ncbi:MAG: hypothetical protein EBY60_06805 [Actinobacteria bacterium]|nr:hypothetical protein [Actinomycetota bacterium]
MPDNDSESGEEQYLRWVNEVLGASGEGGDGSSDATGSAATASVASDDTGSEEVGLREDALAGTIVAERSVLPRPVVSLAQEEVTATPGQPVRVKVTVRNVGPVVETYSLSSVGNGSGWVSLVPSELSLFPGDENSAAIVIKPPRASRVGAQTYPIGIKATSEVDPNESTVAELSITVDPFYESALNVSKTTLEMRRRTSTYASITNNGNTTVRIILRLWDPDGRLRFKVDDSLIELAPGETSWTRVTINGPFHLVGRQRTLSMLSVIEPNKDVTLGTPLEDMQSAVQRVTVIQRPIIRFRLGIIGRLVLLLAVLGIIAAFVLSRLALSGSDDVVITPPATPANFSAEQLGTDQILLRWSAVSGATGYSVYAVGDAGNALSSPGTSTSSDGTSQSISFTSSVVFMPASVGAGGGTGSPSPSASPSPDSPSSSPSPSASSPTSTVYDYDNESPSCGDCTHVGDVPSGTARFVVTKTTLGQANCYRLLATADKTQSLFTPQMCVVMPTAAEVEDAKSAASGSSGSGSGTGGSSEAAASVPCPPFEPMADKLSDTALALTWMLPSETPEGQEAVACDKNTKISGFDIQRQVLSGWSSVSPGPTAGDTALEVKDLEPATKYCFRMRSKAGDQNSAYSATFCKKTKKASASPSPTLTPVPADPNFVASPTPSPSASADAGSAAEADPNTASPAPSASATPSESETASGDATAGALVDSSPAPSPTESSIWSEPKTVPIPL